MYSIFPQARIFKAKVVFTNFAIYGKAGANLMLVWRRI